MKRFLWYNGSTKYEDLFAVGEVNIKTGAHNMDEISFDMLINPPKTKRGRETFERICTAAEELFGENGYYETSITDITNRANVGAGTFYIYFESKIKLYEYLLRQYGHLIRKHISIAIKACTSRRQAEREGLRAWLEFVVDHKYVFSITWESMFIDRRLFDEYYTRFSQSYVRQLEEAQLKGEVRSIDPEIMSFALMGISNFIALHWVVFKEEKNFDYVIDQIMVFIEGMFEK